MTVRIIKHEAVPQTGSFEVRFADGRASAYFYFDDIAGRRLSSDIMDSKRPRGRQGACDKRAGQRERKFSQKIVGAGP